MGCIAFCTILVEGHTSIRYKVLMIKAYAVFSVILCYFGYITLRRVFIQWCVMNTGFIGLFVSSIKLPAHCYFDGLYLFILLSGLRALYRHSVEERQSGNRANFSTITLVDPPSRVTSSACTVCVCVSGAGMVHISHVCLCVCVFK